MKFSKIFVGFAAVLLLASCGSTTESPESTESIESVETTVEHTITFHANWNYGEAVDGEPAPKTLTVADGTVVTSDMLPVADERTGYAFKAWCTTPAGIHTFDWAKAIEKDYDVYASWVDLSAMDKVGLVGTINGWDPTNDDYLLTSEDGIVYTIDDVLLKAGDIWKVVKNNSWDGQINGNHLNTTPDASYYEVIVGGMDDGNIKMLKGGYFDVTVDLSAAKSLSFEFVREFVDENPTVDYEVYLAGTFTTPSWGADESTKFAGSEGVYTLTDYAFPAGEFKLNVIPVFQDGTKGDVAWLGTEVVSELPEGWADNGGNIATVEGTYTVTFTITVGDPAGNGVVTIEGEAAGPILEVVSYTVVLRGTITGWEINPEYMLMGPEATFGVWSSSFTLPAGEFKLNVFSVYEDGTMNMDQPTWVGVSNMETMPEGWSGTDNIVCTEGTYTISYTLAEGDAAGAGVLAAVVEGGTTEPEIKNPEVGGSFVFGMYQGNLEDYYYLTGEMDGHYGATTTDKASAAEIFTIKDSDTDTYRLYYYDSSSTMVYINMVVNGTYTNIAFGTDRATATTYTYDTENQTFIGTVSTGEFFFGTRGDKTFSTIGPCSVDYIAENFVCHLYW